MFSNLASYIFGAAPVENGDPAADVQVPQEAEEVVPNIVEKVEEDEWEMVGEESPSLTLGSLNDPTQRSALGSTGSSDPSMDSEDSGDVPASAHREGEVSAFTRTARRLTVPFGSSKHSGCPKPQGEGVREAFDLEGTGSPQQGCEASSCWAFGHEEQGAYHGPQGLWLKPTPEAMLNCLFLRFVK